MSMGLGGSKRGERGEARSDRRLLVVFVLGGFAVGGAEKQLANLVASRPAVARDIRVHVITFLPTTAPEVARRFAEGGASHTLVDRSSLAFPRFFVRLVREIWRLRPALVHTWLDSSTGAWGRLAALLTRVPVIVHSDRLLVVEGTRAHLLLRPLLDRATARFMPNAKAIGERLIAEGVPRDRIRVMPNGVDLTRFDPERVASARPAWRVRGDATVLGYLGRFRPQKRLDLLVSALRSLDEGERPDAIVFAGDGPTMPQVRALVDEVPWLRDRCRFLGLTDDTPAFLAGIDYLVLPSDSEGLPNVVLEAMAMAKPVVATDVSDVGELLEGGGITVPPGDSMALSRAIAAMQAMGREGRRVLGARARQRVEECYEIGVCADRFWEAHLDLLPAAALRGPSG